MSDTITGYIDHVIFRNEDNGYTVMVLKGVEGEDELTCVGSFPVLNQGQLWKLPAVIYSITYMESSFRLPPWWKKCLRMHWR